MLSPIHFYRLFAERRAALVVILLVAPSAILSCSHAVLSAQDSTALTEVYYSRRGGFAGTNDSLHISAQGSVETHGRIFGERAGKLTDSDRRALVELFRAWDHLKENYPAPRAAADVFEYVIHYQGRTVKASDASMPEPLSRILRKLEAIAGGLGAK